MARSRSPARAAATRKKGVDFGMKITPPRLGVVDSYLELSLQLEIIGEVALALVLGGLIGAEREIAGKPAGFRTQMLVAGASALLVGLSDAAVMRFTQTMEHDLLSSDPIRIIQAIVTGISFLAAGNIILRDRSDRIEGLTTAATIFLSSAIGIAVALRQFLLAIAVTLMVLVVLHGMSLLQARLRGKKPARSAGGDHGAEI